MITSEVFNPAHALLQTPPEFADMVGKDVRITQNAFPSAVAEQRSASTMEALQARESMEGATSDSAAIPQSKAGGGANSPKAEEKGFDLKGLFSAISDALTKVGEFIGSIGSLLLSKADVLKKFVNLIA
ncbi:hypothetical protein [Burkholderia ubonensis]|uniref:hypothetical protein n=1 Tax=Burkholderia ubonensis TaxID=101571 RepID=UPI0007530E89|nr:hypothetical protein [Burkholderia ubonensis]